MADHPTQPDVNVQALQAENALLLQQLHTVQEELERYALGHTPPPLSDGRFVDREDTPTTVDNDFQTALYHSDGPPETADILDNERRARKRAEERRNAILQSTSWRLTAPLRRLRHPFSAQTPELPTPNPTEPNSLVDERRALHGLEAEISALLNTTSWRIAAPIRSLRTKRGVLEAQLAEYEAACERSGSEISRLRGQLEANERELATRRTVSARHSAENDRFRRQLAEREEAVAQQREFAKSRAAENHQLREQLAERQQDFVQQREAAESRAAENHQLREQLATLEKQLAQERTSGEHRTAEQLELTERLTRLQADLDSARSDLSIAIRLNAQREIDLEELQTRYAESMDVRGKQHALLVKLRQRLGEAATYLQQVEDTTDNATIVVELMGALGLDRPVTATTAESANVTTTADATSLTP